MSTAPQTQFALQRLYLSDVSFEAPNSPEVFALQEQPKVDVKLDTNNRKINAELYEVSVRITAQVTFGERTAFLVEVEQSGAFQIIGLDDEKLEHALGAFSPNILFPYAREAIDSLVVKGGFPPLMIAPVNFEAIFAERKQRAAQTASQPETPSSN